MSVFHTCTLFLALINEQGSWEFGFVMIQSWRSPLPWLRALIIIIVWSRPGERSTNPDNKRSNKSKSDSFLQRLNLCLEEQQLFFCLFVLLSFCSFQCSLLSLGWHWMFFSIKMAALNSSSRAQILWERGSSAPVGFPLRRRVAAMMVISCSSHTDTQAGALGDQPVDAEGGIKRINGLLINSAFNPKMWLLDPQLRSNTRVRAHTQKESEGREGERHALTHPEK